MNYVIAYELQSSENEERIEFTVDSQEQAIDAFERFCIFHEDVFAWRPQLMDADANIIAFY